MPFDPEKRQHSIETAGYRVDGDYSHAIPAHPEYNSATDFDDAFYQERRDECDRLVGLPVKPIIYPGENPIPQPPPGSVAVAFAYEGYSGTKAVPMYNVDKFYWLDNDGTITETTYTGTFSLEPAEIATHDGIAYYTLDPANFQFFQDSGGYFTADSIEFLPWTNTTALTDGSFFGAYIESTLKPLAQLNYIDVSNWTSLSAMFSSQVQYGVDWSSAAGWNTSNITDMSNLWKASKPNMYDLSGWDYTNVTTAKAMFSANYDGVPRWIEKIQWGPNLVNLDQMGGNTVAPANLDMCGDGRPLNLGGWCVTNITSAPSQFFYTLADGGKAFYNVMHPRWGTCP
jgi:hypothetical protein